MGTNVWGRGWSHGVKEDTATPTKIEPIGWETIDSLVVFYLGVDFSFAVQGRCRENE